MVFVKYVMFLIVLFALSWLVSKLTREKKGDEREKHIAQLAALSTWNVMVSFSGSQALMSLFRVKLPFIWVGSVNWAIVFISLLIFFMLSYGFHSIRNSSFNGK